MTVRIHCKMLRQIPNNGCLIKRFLFLHGRFLHFFSTSSTTATGDPQPLEECLVKSLGFSKEEAAAISAKVSSRYKSTRNPNSVVNFFKQHGFNDAQIKKIVSRSPRFLRCHVVRTLEPRIRVFQGLGLEGDELGDFVSRCSNVFYRQSSTQIKRDINLLTSILGTNENVVKVLRGSLMWLFSPTAIRNVNLLQKFGVPDGKIQKFLLQNPPFLRLDPVKVRNVCVRVEQDMGVPSDSPAFLAIVRVLSFFKDKTLEDKRRVFEGYGWSESDIGTMLGKLPEVLKLSEATIEGKLEFFMKKLGLDAGYIASHPSVMSYSMEKRVVPRYAVLEVLKQRKLIRAGSRLYGALTVSENQFLKKFVMPYNDELPGLFEAYVSRKMDSYSVS